MVKFIVPIVAVALIGLLLYYFTRKKKVGQPNPTQTGMRVSKFGHPIREPGEKAHDTTPSDRFKHQR